MEPDGILNGSIIKVLMTPAINNAHKSAFKLFTKELLSLFKYHRRNRIFFCITQTHMDNKVSIFFYQIFFQF